MKTSRGSILFCIILLACIVGCSSLSREEMFLKAGNKCYVTGDSDGAIEKYTKAIEINPNFAEAYKNRGFARNDKKAFDGAIADLIKAIWLDPALGEHISPYLAEAYNKRGYERYRKSDYDSAISDYTNAIKIDPNNAEAYFLRADEVIAYLSKLLSLYPGDEKAKLSRARAFLMKDDRASASDDLNNIGHRHTKYIQKYPKLSYHWKAMLQANKWHDEGKKLLKNKEYAKAIECFNKVLAVHPKHYVTLQLRLDACMKGSLPIGTMPDYYSLLPGSLQAKKATLAPQATAAKTINAPATLKQARELMFKKDYAGAVQVLNEVIRKNPKSAESYFLRARAHAHLGRKVEAFSDMKGAIKYGGGYEAQIDKDRLLSAIWKEWQEVVGLAQKIQAKQKDAKTFFFDGLKALSEGKHKEAIKLLDKAEELGGKEKDLFFKRGDAYSMTKAFDKAVEDFTRYISLAPDDPKGYFYRGVGYLNAWMPEESIRDYQKAISLDDKRPEYRLGLAAAHACAMNRELMFENLRTAISEVKVFAKRARQTEYFRLYFDDEEFKKLTK